VRRAPLIAGAVILGAAWTLAAAGHGVTGHMASHMAAVSVAAALLALGLAGTRFDPATRWPRIVGPLPMMLVELIVVWGWHVPALRAWIASGDWRSSR
jgi:putative membrane protein